MRRHTRQKNRYKNEKLWTLLAADVIDRTTTPSVMVETLCGERVEPPYPPTLWYEAQPLSPRASEDGQSEGNTRLDLALGFVEQRGTTKGGIQYGPTQPGSWVCFVEAKCLSDCSYSVSNDPLRNQLARVIENLLCFQNAGVFPDHVYFTLLTPRLFRDTAVGRRSRLFAYKFAEYKADPQVLVEDLTHADPKLPHRKDSTAFRFPNHAERIKALHMNWITFEDILEPAWDMRLDVAGNAEAVIDLRERVERVVDSIQARMTENAPTGA